MVCHSEVPPWGATVCRLVRLSMSYIASQLNSALCSSMQRHSVNDLLFVNGVLLVTKCLTERWGVC